MERIEHKTYDDAAAADILHQASNFYIATKRPKDYGTGEIYTSVEAHTTKYIGDNPGITITEIARDYGKTKGAISQILKKLESRGLIYRRVDSENENRSFLFVTEKGAELNRAHREYDMVMFGESLDPVRELYSDDEINTAFKVLETWLQIRREVQEHRESVKRKEQRERWKEKRQLELQKKSS